MADTIRRGEAWEFDVHIQRKNTSTGQSEPIAADETVTAWIAATYKGDPIIPETVVTLTRRALERRVDARVSWWEILARASVTAVLAGIVTGGTAYEVAEIDGERQSRALIVAD